ncbi:MAG: TetR/AcrR family transcriptional regulator [Pseudonocardia sp.]|uniref:TetR/AcrR family transcriptional regulator n=1 Tax=unclassified Pseudonocardia TaxID=2619320 RepID=UPI001AC376E2|nr:MULTISPECIES: TetR/AcrR family transcriptional regulator [unclassified Pseudonocardia]MBN9110662.1 TetR/AcrR family transcriptional regulator [Pseudonocardia sp.]
MTRTRGADDDARMASRRMDKLERREQLVDAALRVAENEGIPAMSIRRVAEAADVSLGLVHYCFHDKDDLVSAVAARTVEELERAGIDALAQVGGTLLDALRSGVRGMWAAFSSSRQRQLVTYEITTHSLRTEGMRRVAVDQYKVGQMAVEQFLTQAADATGHRWTRPVEHLAGMTLAVIDGVCLRWLVDGDQDGALGRLDGLAETLVRDAEPVDVRLPADDQARVEAS